MRPSNVKNSIIEIWKDAYLNDISIRDERDKNVTILQIERGSSPGTYIVEFVIGDDRTSTDICSSCQYYRDVANFTGFCCFANIYVNKTSSCCEYERKKEY